jgi:hypothetical protein
LVEVEQLGARFKYTADTQQVASATTGKQAGKC